MFDRVNDTIVAVSSPPGISVRGIVRLSGPQSIGLAAGVFESRDGQPLCRMPGHRRALGRVRIDADAFVPAEAYVFRAPASYTRQDIVELHTPGSPPVLAMLLEQLTAAGARPAEPGEFTARAYFAGALDLTEVEGVAAMINARNDSQLRASEALLHGRLSRRSTALREELVDLLALIEAEIDFVDESIEFTTGQHIIAILDKVDRELEALLRDAPAVERLEVLPRVMLVGAPNAGKSTLFNRLSGMDRAIASATAGTTRDVLSAPVSVPGGEILLLDSAGLRSESEMGIDRLGETLEAGKTGFAQDLLTALAEAATRRSIATCDLLLLVIDATATHVEPVRTLQSMPARLPVLRVLNKIDLVPPGVQIFAEAGPAVRVSAVTGEEVDALRERMGQMLFGRVETHGAELLALSNRQRTALSEAREALDRAAKMCKNAKEIKDFAELLAMELRGAINALSLLTGEIATEELLGRIFSRFCIGK